MVDYTDKTVNDLTENEKDELLIRIINDCISYEDEDLICEIQSDLMDYDLLKLIN